ncbi:MAG: hypothetical protein AAF551_10315, partial [Bacteroidota bacterium]
MRFVAFSFLFACTTFLSAQSLKTGKWSGYFQYDSVNVPFSFELLPSGLEVPEFIFKNGKESRQIKNAFLKEDSIIIPMEPFDVTLRATFTAMSMEGVYVKGYKDKKVLFKAHFGAPRFTRSSIKPTPEIQERWNMTFSPGTSFMSKGVGLFEQDGNKVTGTILTTTSDYRYFEGILDGDSLKMSSFDGAHAFMISGKRMMEDRWEGNFFFDNGYSETWEAYDDPEATLPDPFEMVVLEPGSERPYFDLLAAGQHAPGR